MNNSLYLSNDDQNGPDNGIFQNQSELGAGQNLLEVFKADEALDQTGLGDLADGHLKDVENGYDDKDGHQDDTGGNPDVGL